MTEPTASALKVEELTKFANDNEMTRKTTLDEKANNLMNISATVASLYGGFGIAITTKLFNENLQVNLQFVILFIGISALVTSIFFAAKAYLLRQYNYPLNFNKYITKINEDETIIFDQSGIEKDQKRDTADYNTLMIKIYTRCAALNYKINENRAKYLYISQIIFFSGLVTMPLFILTSLT